MPGVSNPEFNVAPAGTAVAISKTVQTEGAQFLTVICKTTTASVGNTVTVTISGTSATGAQWTLLASAAINSVTVTPLQVGPGLPATANVSADAALPPEVVISTVIAGTVAYSIDVSLS